MDNVVLDFPTLAPESKAAENLQDIMPAAQRTRTVPVTSRVVAKGSDGAEVELEKPVSVFVRPLVFRRWPVAMACIAELVGHMPDGNVDLSNEHHLVLWASQVVGNGGDAIFNLISLATDKPVEFYDTIDLDDGIKIVLAVVEVNKDFFVQKVLPLVGELVPQIQSQLATIVAPSGQTE